VPAVAPKTYLKTLQQIYLNSPIDKGSRTLNNIKVKRRKNGVSQVCFLQITLLFYCVVFMIVILANDYHVLPMINSKYCLVINRIVTPSRNWILSRVSSFI
jgi:hypothetical protein